MDTVEILRTLVAFDTTSSHSNLPLIEWVRAYLGSMGARLRLTYDDAGRKANLLASFGPDIAGGIVLSAHTDVVPVAAQDWATAPFELTECEDRLHGRGTADMKGFISCCLAAAADWSKADLARPIHLALSYDEELGCLGVPRLIDDFLTHVPRPALAVVGEPTGMQLGESHRGVFVFLTMFQGRAAHSSNPAAGLSAIAAAARFVGFIEVGRTSTDLGGAEPTTFNVGRIDGGSALNIVPSRCEVTWEVRPSPGADVEALLGQIEGFLKEEAARGLRVSARPLATVPPLAPTAAGIARQFAADFGASLPAAALPFGTEAGLFQSAGIPAIVCGPGSIEQAHQPNEWISRDQLQRAGQFLGNVTRWAVAADMSDARGSADGE